MQATAQCCPEMGEGRCCPEGQLDVVPDKLGRCMALRRGEELLLGAWKFHALRVIRSILRYVHQFEGAVISRGLRG